MMTGNEAGFMYGLGPYLYSFLEGLAHVLAYWPYLAIAIAIVALLGIPIAIMRISAWVYGKGKEKGRRYKTTTDRM